MLNLQHFRMVLFINCIKLRFEIVFPQSSFYRTHFNNIDGLFFDCLDRLSDILHLVMQLDNCPYKLIETLQKWF